MPDGAPFLRFPTIARDRLVFVADDDLWLARLRADGGSPEPASRLTAEGLVVSEPRLSPDGALVAYTGRRDQAAEIYLVSSDGGDVTRLTHLGDPSTRVLGWARDGQPGGLLVASAAGEPFVTRTLARWVGTDGSMGDPLPYGPVSAIASAAAAAGGRGPVVLGVNQSLRRGAAWKRYRGGTAGALWIDLQGDGAFQRFLQHLGGQIEDPCFVGERLAFLSDHEGVANVYSVLPDGDDLRRHSDHGHFYARALSGDGSRLVYQHAGDLYLLDDLAADSIPRRLDLRLGGAARGRHPFPLKAADHLGPFSPDHDGRSSLVELRGSVHLLAHREGPATLLAPGGSSRGRLPRLLGTGEAARAVLVTDADGEDAVEILPLDRSRPSAPTRHGSGQLGRVLDLAAAPDGTRVAVATHDGRVLVLDAATGAVSEIDRSPDGEATGLCFSPDSTLLAWSQAGPDPLRQIRLARLDTGEVVEVTPLRFQDHDPVFTSDGKHLAFLSVRTFDPLYDAHVFDLVFASAARPYLVTLSADTPSPFAPDLRGAARPGDPGEEASKDRPGAGPAGPPVTALDPEGLSERLVALPVAAGRYSRLRVAGTGLLFLAEPLAGVLGDERPPAKGPSRPRLVRYDLKERREKTVVDELDAYEPTGDGRSVVVRDASSLRLVPADRRVEAGKGDADAPEGVVEIDLDRLRQWVDPVVEWQQMFDEAARLMRDHYFTPDMSGVDWDGVVARYRPLVGRLATRDELSEVIWEVQGELGTSHAYERPPAPPVDEARRIGYLGADFERRGTALVVRRVLPAESSVPGARSPLAVPGARVGPSDELVAIDGRPVDARLGAGPLLLGAADRPVRLEIRPAGGGPTREIAVVPLKYDRALRYHDWVASRRAEVRRMGQGRVGYVHVPDMVGSGWAELHRDLRLEVRREALVVDVRNNRGGHVSELVIEKLARTVRAFDLGRHRAPSTYPRDAPRGPLVAVCDEYAGSDGDVVTAAFKAYGLGPVVGVRTWGGVIGIDQAYELVDGTSVTQPRYAFWFAGGPGWGIENHGVDPDVEVPIRPQDWAVGSDPQLETAVRLAIEALAARPPVAPPLVSTRPSRVAPVLGPRP